jgi:hypothetical protein
MIRQAVVRKMVSDSRERPAQITEVSMKTITVQIGNSDDKLTQNQWSDFVNKIDRAIQLAKARIHFMGGSYNDAPWQNFCWVFQLPEDNRESGSLFQHLKLIRKDFQQDSLAWTEGETLFV